MYTPTPIRFALVLWAFVFSLMPLAAAAQEPWFEISRLNAGLGPPPADLQRDTPLGAVESLQSYLAREDYDAAAHLLDLSSIPTDAQAQRGPDLARQLGSVLDRKIILPWEDLTDRPDGWLTGTTDNEAVGRVRRSILLDALEMGDHDVTLRLNRVKPANREPVWVIAAQSVGNIAPLFDLYGPTEMEKMLPDWSRERGFGGLYRWEVIVVPIAMLVALFLGWLTLRWVGWAAGLWQRPLYQRILRALRWPATILVTTAFIGFLTQSVLIVSGTVGQWLSPIIITGYIFGATLAMVLVIDVIFERVTQKDPQELADPENIHLRSVATTISGLRKFVVVTAVLLGSGVVLSQVTHTRSLGLSLLASAGAVTLIIGFAAREVLGNILAACQIALNRSARIGDQLLFEGHFCTVERIHFTYVQLRIWNGNRLVVPVSYFVSDAFENWSIEEVAMVRPIILTLSQSADIDALRSSFLAWIEERDNGVESGEDARDVGPVESANVRVLDQDMFGQKVRFELPTPNPATFWQMECEFREMLMKKARALDGLDARMLPPEQVRDRPDG